MVPAYIEWDLEQAARSLEPYSEIEVPLAPSSPVSVPATRPSPGAPAPDPMPLGSFEEAHSPSTMSRSGRWVCFLCVGTVWLLLGTVIVLPY